MMYLLSRFIRKVFWRKHKIAELEAKVRFLEGQYLYQRDRADSIAKTHADLQAAQDTIITSDDSLTGTCAYAYCKCTKEQSKACSANVFFGEYDS